MPVNNFIMDLFRSLTPPTMAWLHDLHIHCLWFKLSINVATEFLGVKGLLVTFISQGVGWGGGVTQVQQ